MSVYAHEYGYFFNSSSGDRTYNAESFEAWLKPFFTSGVFAGGLAVSAQSTPDMTVSVSSGYAFLDGKAAHWIGSNTVSIAVASGSYDRIDTIVLRRDNTNRAISIEVVKGTASSSPQPTAPTRNADTFELVIAEVLVGRGVTAITQANITDKRPDTDVCGYVMTTIETPDFSELYAQFEAQAADEMETVDAQLDNWYEAKTEDWEDWFQNLQDQLDDNQAGHLQNEIDALSSGKANKADTIFTTYLSRGRGMLVPGTGSFAFGDNVDASAPYSFAVGKNTAAMGDYSSVEGIDNLAYHRSVHVSGEHNTEDTNPADHDARGTYVEIVGNGSDSSNRSNARALDWSGNEYLNGDLFINCDGDSTNGTPISKICLTGPTSQSISAAGTYTTTNSVTGLTSAHRVMRWGFSAGDENNPPADIELTPNNDGTYTVIVSNYGGTAFTMTPVFILPMT